MVNKNKKKTFYMLVTRDKYSLPLVVTDNLEDMVKISGKTKNMILSSLSHKRPGFERVIIRKGEEGWEDEWE